MKFSTSYADDVVWLKDINGGGVYKSRYVTNFVGEVVAITVATGSKGGK
jgi:hypothetical protein